MIFVLGFLSMVNLVLSITAADEKDLRSDEELIAEVETTDDIPKAASGRMLNLASTVLDAIQTLEEKYNSR